MSQQRLILFDGTGVVYRAFYAIKDLSTSGGRPINAVLGFSRMFQSLLREWKPSHCAVIFDGGLPAERMKLLEEYKAQRPPMPDLLRVQLVMIEEYLDCANVPWVRVDVEEADDVLAVLVKRYQESVEELFIVTSDKDMYQLVNERVRILSPSKAGGVMGPEEVQKKTGVYPKHIVDWLALIGDSSDNIPGVPGVGPKTAAKLLNEFPSLDEIWKGLDGASSSKLRSLLEANRERVERNVEIVRLRSWLDCPFALDEMAVQEPDGEKMLAFLEDLELHSLVREFSNRLKTGSLPNGLPGMN